MSQLEVAPMQTALDLGQDQWSSIFRQFQSRYFATLEHNLPEDAFSELYSSLELLLDQHPYPKEAWLQDNFNQETDEIECPTHSDQTDDWHLYRTRYEIPGKPTGLTDRLIEGKALSTGDKPQRSGDDPKVYFHYSPLGEELVRARHDEMNWSVPPELEALYAEATKIHRAGRRILRSTLYQLEQDCSMPRMALEYFTANDEKTSPLRILGYYAGFETMAKGHLDKGFGTVALHETSLGLRIGRPDFKGNGHVDKESSNRNLQLVERDVGQAAIFLAKSFHSNLGAETGLLPAWHDVTSVENNQFSQRFQRLSTIFFANSSKSGIHMDKDSIH